MRSLIRHLLPTRETVFCPSAVQPTTLNRSWGLITGLLALSASTLWSSQVQAQSILPSGGLLNFQTSAPRRCANIGDWYTTAGSGDNDTGSCGPAFGGDEATTAPLGGSPPPGFHSFFINVTQADIDAAGGSIVIEIIDAPTGGPIDETEDANDPTQFQLFNPNGVIIDTLTFNSAIFPDAPDPFFTAITEPGVYTVTSSTGGIPIDDNDDFEINNDDNSFQISVPVENLLIGQLLGSFQQDTGGTLDEIDLFFLVGPSTDNLFLRNFDLDEAGDVDYTDPQGFTQPGTVSGDQVWNGGLDDLNNGGDEIPVSTAAPFAQAGRWELTLSNYTTQNQTILEANTGTPATGLTPLALLDQPPLQAGNFSITPDTTLATTVGTEVCHPFTVTNNFFTSDIVNLELAGTDDNFVVELRDATGTTALIDTDEDGRLDTGILQAGESREFTLCVTPQEDEPDQDITVISGVSFIDTVVRQQAVADGLPGADPTPEVQSVTKTTLISEIGLAKEIGPAVPVAGQPGFFDLDITYRVTNLGIVPIDNVQITDNLQAVLIDNPTFNGAPGNGADGFTVQSVTLDAFSGVPADAPTANDAYDGNTDQALFTPDANSFASGDTATVTVSLRVDLSSDGILETNNQAQTTGLTPPEFSPGGTPVTVADFSQTGESVDPDEDGDPTNNDVPSSIQIPVPAVSEIGLAKDFSSQTPVPGQPNVFDLGITYTVTNTGETALDNVQITDNLQAVLIDSPTVGGAPGNAADSFTVQSVTLDAFSGAAATAPTPNPAFDGNSDQTLFTPAPNRFADGDTAVVTVIVRVDVGSDGILETENSANVSGLAPTGAAVTDVSQTGTEVDPDGDGLPTNNDEPTPIEVGPPEIGLAKAIASPVPVAGQPGFFNFDITYTVTNTGGVPLNNVQLTDDLQSVLIDSPTVNGAPGDSADGFSVLAVTLTTFTGDPATAPTPNSAYDGNIDQTLFTSAANTFAVGDTAIVTITVQVDLSSDGSLQTENSAETTGTDPDGTAVSDTSQDGDMVDPDGDGPGDDSVPSPISLSPDPSLVLVKRITNIVRQGVPLVLPGITDFQNDPTDVDTQLQATFAAAGIPNQPAGLLELPDGFELQPNDEIEYTLYFWNNGFVNLTPVNICDELEPPSILNSTTLTLQGVGPFIAAPTFTSPVGALIQARPPLDPIDGTADPLESGCLSNPGIFPSGPPGPLAAGGGVVAGPFSVPVNQYGAIRFRVVVP